jgi:predicted PurR-regulated permease PerM
MSVQYSTVRWWLLLFVTAISLYLCWRMIQPFLGVVAWATVLVIVFYPVHKRLSQRIKRPSLTALVSCVLVILIILVPVALITLAVVNELAGAVQSLQAAVNYVLDPNSRLTGPVMNFLSRFVDISQLRSEEFLLERLKGVSGQIAGQTLGFLGGLASFFIQMFFVVFTMYYFFKDGENTRALFGMRSRSNANRRTALFRGRVRLLTRVFMAYFRSRSFKGSLAGWRSGYWVCRRQSSGVL